MKRTSEIPLTPEVDMTVAGKGGRPKGERARWDLALWVSEAERLRIREAAEAGDEKVAGMLRRLALEEAERRGK